MTKASAPQMISLPAGRIGFGASWQSSIALPLLEELDALLLGVALGLGVRHRRQHDDAEGADRDRDEQWTNPSHVCFP